MTHSARPLVLLALMLPLCIAEIAHAQTREFNGKIVAISGKSVVVEDRRGDRLSFDRANRTRVDGKSGWEALALGDEVIVRWRLRDGPREAYHVIVLGSPTR